MRKKKKTSEQRRLQRKRAKERAMNLPCNFDIEGPITFDCCTTAAIPAYPISPGEQMRRAKTNRKNEPMNAYITNTTATVEPTEQTQRHYLRDRLNEIFHQKAYELREPFHMDPTPPATPEELVEMITKGKYSVKPKESRSCFDNAYSAIIWRDPATPADKDGFEKATNALEDARQAAKDEIVILPPADGLTKLRAFEATTFH